MTKQELMENYTAEQLADMVVELNEKDEQSQKIYDALQEDYEKIHKKYKKMKKENNSDSGENDFRDEINFLQSEVEKYRKAFEDAKKERDCQIAEYQKKICELTAENEKLKGNVGSKGYCDKQNKTNNFYGLFANSAKNLKKDDVLIFLGVLAKELIANGIDFRYEMGNEPKVWDIKIKSDKSISDFLPTEPIRVADMLINTEGEYERNPIAKALYGGDKGTYHIFDIGELRQIAEHLLVYCNNQKENVDE